MMTEIYTSLCYAGLMYKANCTEQVLKYFFNFFSGSF